MRRPYIKQHLSRDNVNATGGFFHNTPSGLSKASDSTRPRVNCPTTASGRVCIHSWMMWSERQEHDRIVSLSIVPNDNMKGDSLSSAAPQRSESSYWRY